MSTASWVAIVFAIIGGMAGVIYFAIYHERPSKRRTKSDKD